MVFYSDFDFAGVFEGVDKAMKDTRIKDLKNKVNEAKQEQESWVAYARQLEKRLNEANEVLTQAGDALKSQKQEIKKLSDDLEIARNANGSTRKKLSGELAELHNEKDPSHPLADPKNSWNRSVNMYNFYLAIERYKRGLPLPENEWKDEMRNWPHCTKCGNKVPHNVGRCRSCGGERKLTPTPEITMD